ncbi:CC0125/CC1285 family lipoprotein [Henriciella aquimarina]|uniref:CC0125/CC1285 family lipoprotein n=1 Tax=Henriciella aquimarina TaxID=545261 RepID=UPI000A04E2F3|nr:hypothetical protein [Henriciella aquimarina]
MKHAIIGIIALTLTAGCATYTEGGAFGGFNETPLARDTYRIQAYGNGLTSRQKTNAIAMVRAADLARMNGYSLFMILDYDEWADTSHHTTPATVTTDTSYSGSGYTSASANCNTIGYGYGSGSTWCSGNARTNVSGNATSRTTINPGQTYETEKPRTDLVVKFVSEGTPEASNALSVRQIMTRYGNAAGLNAEQLAARITPASVASKPARPAQLTMTAPPTAQSVPASRASSAADERTIEEVYASLPPHEKRRVDAMSIPERIGYLKASR